MSIVKEWYLPFACRHMSWVDVVGLKGSKPQLNWDCSIAVRTREKHWYLQLFKQCQQFSTFVIRGVIQEYHCVLSPLLVLLVEFLHQLYKEDRHH